MTPPPVTPPESPTRPARILTPGSLEPLCDFEYPDLGPGNDPAALIVHITRDDMSQMDVAAVRIQVPPEDPRVTFVVVPTLSIDVTLHRDTGQKPN